MSISKPFMQRLNCSTRSKQAHQHHAAAAELTAGHSWWCTCAGRFAAPEPQGQWQGHKGECVITARGCPNRLLRGRTSSHGMSPFLVLMLFVSSWRGRYGFVKTSGLVGKGEDG